MAKAKLPTDNEAAEEAAAAAFRKQIRFWLITAVLFSVFLYLFSDILLPFVAGMALAYFLDPVADRLQKLGLSRLMATVVILVCFLVLLVLGLVIIIPVLASQMADFAAKVPGYLERLQQLITDFNPQWLEQRFGVDAEGLREGLNSLIKSGFGFVTTIFQGIWSSGVALFSIASLFVVTPVVAFYMLLDWDRMVAVVDSWIPRDHVVTVRQIARDINTAIAGFVRGQGTLCLILGIFYAAGLTLTGLNFGVLIGLFAGLVSFIPYVGSLLGLVLSIGVAFVQFWPDWTMVAAVAVVFFVGQFIEGNILQPRLVGKSVGLHPVWLMFALVAFGAMFGFVGLLVAVPSAAAVAVLVRFAIGRYLDSPLYHGHALEPVEARMPSTAKIEAGKPSSAKVEASGAKVQARKPSGEKPEK
ncbi:putative PurR-regulated permease PerM [Aminobacter lissarensis]|uniref:PurR-regulated permease PerM n=1 Tax=Aminobacter carboxidus TaxID=376165 RepID=A0A8E1WCI7_9HYPH|nr:AI-2E family transporter [Aminobacter lissarensis]MBB6466186.1 putative PurR-regulated permease PerM [Aminobacter lissarensis]